MAFYALRHFKFSLGGERILNFGFLNLVLNLSLYLAVLKISGEILKLARKSG
ncbi:hypothetical protein [uncultured Campylobacter sp.]|uniref:hypothetical protein n=1 Tax=uncultured Campylobacter sp. TaxID=218934 RepID=UPI0026129006|nr:hypothetical protein [uncultured Campylobacter sp.]